MSVTKTDIIDRLYSELDFSKRDAVELVDVTFGIIKNTLGQGEKVKIPGFGHFLVRDKNGRMGRNPHTGEAMKIELRRVPHF